MPINGICHDFAFSRCQERSQWASTPSALQDASLWRQVQIYMIRLQPGNLQSMTEGVFTVVSPTRVSGAYCTHSYYVDRVGGFLLSTNDPFGVHVGGNNIAPVHVGVAGVVATAYTISDFANVLSVDGDSHTATIGSDKRALSFYHCNITTARQAWWHA